MDLEALITNLFIQTLSIVLMVVSYDKRNLLVFFLAAVSYFLWGLPEKDYIIRHKSSTPTKGGK